MAVAFIVAAVVFPPRPDRLVEQALARLRGELTAVVGDSAQALAQVDTPSAERALGRARGLDQQLSELDEAIAVARETLITRPRHARDRRRVAEIREAAPHLDLAIRNLRVLARGVVRHTRAGARPSGELLAAFRELQAALGALLVDRDALERHVSEVVARGGRASAGRDDLAVQAIVAQLRSTAVDLLRASGLEQEDALRHVAAAAG